MKPFHDIPIPDEDYYFAELISDSDDNDKLVLHIQ